ncbi:family 78 glycoside hydrolase catalytic domain [uncultured Trichococcus sp.]|uniref:family 78 glycoside hydrolase catalytic domain n=1 Tax=uncultured Trichococcus sp. TaxID=189665 RepID=UPI002A18B254|nr:family 78 glycoside hydrolase catalytic domain [uncultured Trichococcus sp.]
MTKLYDLKVVSGMDVHFSWKLVGEFDQVSYQIKVNDSRNNLLWDSGKVISEERHNILAPGFPSEKRLFWNLTIELSDGSLLTAEGSEFFSQISEWQAQWIEPERIRKPLIDKKKAWEVKKFEKDPIERLDPPIYFRKEFELKQLPTEALIYMSARGIYEVWINNHKVSSLFAPGYTSYQKHIDYQVASVTNYLNVGKNVIGLVLADGWYTGKIEYIGVGQQYGTENAIISELKLNYSDGSESSIITDDSFKWTDQGPQKYADLYVGEYYKQADELQNWLEAGFDDSRWEKPVIKKYGYSELKLQTTPEIIESRTIRPTIIRTPEGELVLDAGEVIVGYTSFNNILLAKNTVVSLEHSETLDENGNFLQNILGQNKEQKDYYESGQDGAHSWKASLTFHGFRYVKIEGTMDCDPEHYLIHVIVTPMKRTGFFRTSDERLNKLQENIVRSQEGNMISIPTDCPQRERTGWTGDMQVYAPTACYEMDVEQFLRHWLEDMKIEQHEDGQIPQVIPCPPSHDYMKPDGEDAVNTAGWSDAAIIVPWRLYEFYGDVKILAACYDMMFRYMKSVENRLSLLPENYNEMTPERQAYQKYLWNTDFQFGDWLMPSVGQESASITGNEVATLMVVMTTDLMSKICGVVGKLKEQKYYRELNQKVKAAYVQEYMNPDGTMTSDYQGVYILALATETVPENLKKKSIARLKELIAKNGDCLDTGFLSVPYLLPILQELGELELAHRLLFQDKCPSWLYEIKMGATTIWEVWDAYSENGVPKADSMNHFAFGCVGEYLFRTILGIDQRGVGFKNVIIKPDFTSGLRYADGQFDSIWGPIKVFWEIVADEVTLSVELPPNVSADINIHGQVFENITHNFKHVSNLHTRELEIAHK